jgi:hypothetical protein
MASDLGLSQINWNAPWLMPWRDKGEALAQSMLQGLPVHDAFNVRASASACPVQFVPQSALPEGQAYEQFIFEHRQVPTREGLHDFFNALCWLHFPNAKQQLNRLQAHAIQTQGVGAVRGPVRDAVTVFDENAMLVQVNDGIWHALQCRQWHDAFLTRRTLWQEAQLQIFGHAALEKLVKPYKAITVHMWRVPAHVPCKDWDDWLAQDLTTDKLATKPFVAVPVLGIPDWWAGNESADFYKDLQVFRAPTGPHAEQPAAP